MNKPHPLVYIVDDDAGIQQSLQVLLQSSGYEARSFLSAEAFLADYYPDQQGCLLLDLRMPGMSGEELLRELRRRKCHLPVIVLSGHGDVPIAVQMMKLGAFDFLVKPVAYPSLLDRLQQAIQHQDAAGAPPTIPPDIASRLTPREHDILLGLCSGKPSKRIAFELGISAKTVEHYRARLFQKFDAANAVELVRKIMTTTSHQ